MQSNKRGLCHGEVRGWSKSSGRERKNMVIKDMRESVGEKQVQTAVLQSQQDQWVSLEGALQRSLTWNHIWHVEPYLIHGPVEAQFPGSVGVRHPTLPLRTWLNETSLSMSYVTCSEESRPSGMWCPPARWPKHWADSCGTTIRC